MATGEESFLRRQKLFRIALHDLKTVLEVPLLPAGQIDAGWGGNPAMKQIAIDPPAYQRLWRSRESVVFQQLDRCGLDIHFALPFRRERHAVTIT